MWICHKMRGIRGCNPFKVLQIYVIVQKNYEQFPRLHYCDMMYLPRVSSCYS